MDEERAAIQELVPIDLLPLVGGGPRRIAFLWQRVRRRTKAQHVHEQGLVVAFPAVLQKAAFGLPPVGDRRSTVPRPLPIGTAVERIGQRTDFPLVLTI